MIGPKPNMVYLAPYRENIRRAIPHLIQEEIRNQCGDKFVHLEHSSHATLSQSCDLKWNDDYFTAAAKYLRNQHDSLLDLHYQIAVYSTQVQNMIDVKRQVKELINTIGTSKLNR
jgi:hypothetical protein